MCSQKAERFWETRQTALKDGEGKVGCALESRGPGLRSGGTQKCRSTVKLEVSG